MAVELPDPKVIVDSVGNGAINVLEAGARIAEKQGGVLTGYASSLKGVGENIKAKLPDDPSVLPDAAIKIGGATVKAIIGTAESFVSGLDETAKAIKGEIDRVIR